jgi:hypothetical protein
MLPKFGQWRWGQIAGAASTLIVLSGVGVGAAEVNDPASSESDSAAAIAQFRREVHPVLQEYRFDCHADGMSKGNLACSAAGADADANLPAGRLSICRKEAADG